MSHNLKIILGYITICILWGSTWIAIRIGLDTVTPLLSAGIRFLIASGLFYGLIKARGLKIQTDPVAIKLYIILGLFSFVIPFGLVYWAEQFIESALASLIFGIFPFSTILFSRFMLKDYKIGPYKAVAVIVGFAGVFLIFSENLSFDFSNDLMGSAAVVISAIMQGWIAVTMKKEGGHLNPVSLNLVPLLIAGVLMTAYGVLFEDMSKVSFSVSSASAIVYLAIFGTVFTFSIYYWLMKQIDVVLLSLSTFITPIVSVILGFLILNERLSAQALLGGGLVLSGILISNFKGLKKYILKEDK
ncbi:MAG: DMT family transporter [Rhodothermaceae bacterium]